MRAFKQILFSGGLSSALMISLAGFAFGQSNQAAADKSWNAFWTKFTRAVKIKNRQSLMALTSKKFFSPSGETIGKLLNGNDWRWLTNPLKYGTKPHRCRGLICRITRNPKTEVESSLVFVFEKNRWGFLGQLGE